MALLLPQKFHVKLLLHAVTGGSWLTVLFVFVMSNSGSCLLASRDCPCGDDDDHGSLTAQSLTSV